VALCAVCLFDFDNFFLQIDVTEYTFKLALLQRKYEQVSPTRGAPCLLVPLQPYITLLLIMWWLIMLVVLP